MLREEMYELVDAVRRLRKALEKRLGGD